MDGIAVGIDVFIFRRDLANSTCYFPFCSHGSRTVEITYGSTMVVGFAPMSRIANDYVRGLSQLPKLKKLTDDLMLFDNTAHTRDARLVAHFQGGKLVKLAREIRVLSARLRTRIGSSREGGPD